MVTKTIVFIHGMYMNPISWERWITFFGEKGYECFAPAWPGRYQPIEILRQKCLSQDYGKLGLTDVVQATTELIESLPKKPILIGHSMGGLIVQLLLQKDLASAGVAIDSAPPMGVLTTKWSFLRSNLPHISPFVSQNNPIRMSFRRFQYTFVNELPLAEQQAAYDRYVVPESRRVPRESLMARIDFSKPHAPLLLIAGSSDHLIPASLNKTNFNRYKSSTSVTVFKEFPGRTHFIIGQKNWEEVANYILAWLNDNGM
jgi:alpha-beta hydrolase superfamily lysophospholipase